MTSPSQLVDHFFRHEYGRLVAVLTRQLGVQNLDLVEDVVQAALVRAMLSWSRSGIPKDPGAWLYRVAKNAALDGLRRNKTWKTIQERIAKIDIATEQVGLVRFADELVDDQLRMLFICCQEAIPPEAQISFALKTLCGFGVAEIARALLTTEANIQKRLTRAKEKLREIEIDPDTLTDQDIVKRLDAVHTILYLLFNEGYSSSQPDELIRQELCEEAVRLSLLLTKHRLGDVPSTHALLALMLLHAARFEARVNHEGELLLLEEQDRSRWDWSLINEGLKWLDRSASGESVSRFHLEAAIAAEHCLASTFAETNWQRIVGLFDRLHQVAPSSIHSLNRAIAIAYLHGPQAGLAGLRHAQAAGGAKNYHYWHSAMGELHRRLGQFDQALCYFQQALALTQSSAEQHLIRKRLKMCEER